MKYRFIYIVLLIILGGNYVQAQLEEELLYKNYTIHDGLPSNEVYHLIQDNNKNIWMTTDNGLVKYDGNTFKVFNSTDGLPNSTVFRLYKQKNGRIYGECTNNKYFFIENDTIYPLPIKDEVDETLKGAAIRTFSFHVDSMNNYHIGSNCGYFMLNKNGQLVHRDYEQPLKKEGVLGMLKFKVFDDYVFTYRYSPEDSRESAYLLDLDKENYSKIFVDGGKATAESNYACKTGENEYALIFRGMINYIKDGALIESLTPENKPINVDYVDQQLWVSTANGGVKSYDITDSGLVEKKHYFKNYSVTSILKDHENGYWFSTREGGIFHVQNFDVTKIYQSEPYKNISSFFVDDNYKLLGFDEGDVIELNSKKKIRPAGLNIENIEKLGDQYLVFARGKIESYSMNLVNTEKRYLDESKRDIASDFVELEDVILFYSRGSIIVYDKHKQQSILKIEDSIDSKVIKILNSNDKLYVGTGRGVNLLEKESGKFVKTVTTSSSVVTLFEKDNNIITACRNGSFYLINNDFGKKEYSNLNSFNINRIVDVLYKDNSLVVSTGSTIYKFRYNSESKEWSLNNQLFIPGAIQIIEHNNALYYVTIKSIYKDLNAHNNRVFPITSITSILINNQIIEKNNNVFSHRKNNIEFTLSSVGYSSNKRYYKWKLVGHESNYQVSESSTVKYSSLTPGDYEFIFSCSMNGIDFSKEQSFNFSINPPFWKRGWFMGGVIFLILLSVLLFYRWKINKTKSAYELRERISILKSQALTSQLNPHLVFNILNSIQGVISEGEIEKANIHLSKFSKFLRMSLELSKQMRIRLQEELGITRKYIELEQVRFPKGLSFELVNNVKKSDFALPPLLIQPFIENAVKYGIGKSNIKHLKVSIQIDCIDNYLLIKIIDNGIGCEEGTSFKEGDGIRISRERLKVLNEKNDVKIKCNPSGTTVMLTIFK